MGPGSPRTPAQLWSEGGGRGGSFLKGVIPEWGLKKEKLGEEGGERRGREYQAEDEVTV